MAFYDQETSGVFRTIWDKVFKNGSSKKLWKTVFKEFEVIWSA